MGPCAKVCYTVHLIAVRMRPRRRAEVWLVARMRRSTVAAVIIAGSLAMAGTTVVQGQDASPGGSPGPGGFRPACDLITADAVTAIVGATVTADDSSPALYCSWKQGDTSLVDASLTTSYTLPMLVLGLPDAQDATIGGRAALVSAGSGTSSLATAAVALDDGGVLTVEVGKGAPATDPTAAATAIAEAMLAGGPVTAVVPSTPGLPSLDYAGSLCDLMSVADLKDAMSISFKKLTDSAAGCIYQGGSLKQVYEATIGIIAGGFGYLPAKGSTDVNVAGRAAKWLAKSESLFVDIGGRLLDITLGTSPQPKGAAAAKLQASAQALAETALGRMTPQAAGPSASPDLGICALLGLDALSQATGVTFARQDLLSPTNCAYTSADQRSGVLLLVSPAPSLDAAWKGARSSFPLPAKPTKATVGGQPAYTGQLNPTSAAVAVDLAGTPDGDGKVLGVLTIDMTPASGDLVALTSQIAEMAVANR